MGEGLAFFAAGASFAAGAFFAACAFLTGELLAFVAFFAGVFAAFVFLACGFLGVAAFFAGVLAFAPPRFALVGAAAVFTGDPLSELDDVSVCVCLAFPPLVVLAFFVGEGDFAAGDGDAFLLAAAAFLTGVFLGVAAFAARPLLLRGASSSAFTGDEG